MCMLHGVVANYHQVGNNSGTHLIAYTFLTELYNTLVKIRQNHVVESKILIKNKF